MRGWLCWVLFFSVQAFGEHGMPGAGPLPALPLPQEAPAPFCADDFLLPLVDGAPLGTADLPLGERAIEEVLDDQIAARRGDLPTARSFKNLVMLKRRLFHLDDEVKYLTQHSAPGADAARVLELKRTELQRLRAAITTLTHLLRSGKRTAIVYENIDALVTALTREQTSPTEIDEIIPNKAGPAFSLPRRQRLDDRDLFGPRGKLRSLTVPLQERVVRLFQMAERLTKNPPNETTRDEWEPKGVDDIEKLLGEFDGDDFYSLLPHWDAAKPWVSDPDCLQPQIARSLRFLQANAIALRSRIARRNHPELEPVRHPPTYAESEPEPALVSNPDLVRFREGALRMQPRGSDTPPPPFVLQGSELTCGAQAIQNAVRRQFFREDGREIEINIPELMRRMGGATNLGIPPLPMAFANLRRANGIPATDGTNFTAELSSLTLHTPQLRRQGISVIRDVTRNGGSVIATLDTETARGHGGWVSYLPKAGTMHHIVTVIGYSREPDPNSNRDTDFFLVQDSHQGSHPYTYRVPAAEFIERVQDIGYVRLVK